jgi:hypothetical protein
MLQIASPATAAHSTATLQRDAYVHRTAEGREPRLVSDDIRDSAAGDTLHLSEAAEQAAEEQGGLRGELIQRIRAEIEAGQYLTPEKIDIAAEELRRKLRSA